MALSRKKWNYIIIIASVLMISVLSFITSKTSDMPDNALPLFDDALPLKQLQLNSQWLQHKQGQWHCADTVLNCQQWAKAWQDIVISALKDEPIHTSTPIKITFSVEAVDEPQVWLLFADEGLLQSPSFNWYQIPPSLRADLLPVIQL
jgi:hypothetical protein